MNEEESVGQPMHMRQIQWALKARKAGFTVLPLNPGSKIPVCKWDIWENDQSEEHITSHWTAYPDHDIAYLVGSEYMVADADSPESLEALLKLEREHKVDPSIVVKTRRGEHRYYGVPPSVHVKAQSFNTAAQPDGIDLKHGRSLVTAAGSTNKKVMKWDISTITDMATVSQDFVDAMARHNGTRDVAVTLDCEKRPPLGDAGLPKIRALIDHIPPEGHDRWRDVGMIIHRETEGSEAGCELFDQWSGSGSTYKGRRETVAKWRSFDKPVANALTFGSLITLAKDMGVNIREVLRGFDEEFERTVTVVVEAGVAGESISEKEHPLLRYSVVGKLEEIQRRARAQKKFLDGLAVSGQLTVIYAAYNTGKTLVVLNLLCQSIKAGEIDPSKLFYLNMDDNEQGLSEKVAIAKRHGFEMLAGGLERFNSRAFFESVPAMIANGTARGSILVLDTLTRFVDTMSKADTRAFTELMREFVVNGGTVIAIGHVNKNPDVNGDVKFSGTNDVPNDFDVAYMMRKVSEDEVSGRRTVAFRHFKERGQVVREVAYSYLYESDVSYERKFESVQLVDAKSAARQKLAALKNSDAKCIDHIRTCIAEGLNQKGQIKKEVGARAKVSRDHVEVVLDRYMGTTAGECLWSFDVEDRGAKVYKLLTPPTKPGAVPDFQVSSLPVPARASGGTPALVTVETLYEENDDVKFEDVKF